MIVFYGQQGEEVGRVRLVEGALEAEGRSAQSVVDAWLVMGETEPERTAEAFMLFYDGWSNGYAQSHAVPDE